MVQDAEMAKATLVQNKYTDELMRKKHVMGVAVGLGQKGGATTGKVCLVVMVDKKVPPETLDAKDRIPAELDGVPVDVQEIGVPRAY
jgi:hypothetical protein